MNSGRSLDIRLLQHWQVRGRLSPGEEAERFGLGWMRARYMNCITRNLKRDYLRQTLGDAVRGLIGRKGNDVLCRWPEKGCLSSG